MVYERINKWEKNEALLPVSLGVRPGVSVSSPDVLMGSVRKLPSHGMLTEVWDMRAPCLAPLPALHSVRGPHAHPCPPPCGAGGWYMHKHHPVSSAGGRSATCLLLPSHTLEWFALAGLKGECWHVFRWVCCACVCTGLPSYPRNNISSLHSSPAQCVPGAFVGGKMPAWPCGSSNGFFTYTYKQALVLSQGFRSSSNWKSLNSNPVNCKLCAQNSKEGAKACAWLTRIYAPHQV